MSISPIFKQFAAGLLAVALTTAPAFAARMAEDGPVVRNAVNPDHSTTTLDDQVDLAVTVYNSNIALVRDVRQLTLPGGIFDLRFMDIAASVNPATVHFRSMTEPSRLNVLEQNYEFDLLDPQKLLNKYIGREVTLVRARQENNSTRYEEVKAILLSNNNGPVWKIGNEIVTGMYADHIRFPELPDNLYSRPTLVWMLQNSGGQKHKVEASYLTGNLAWNADYVLTVGRDDKAGDLDGWVTMTNNSGTAYKNAKLQFVAGDLNRIINQYGRNEMAAKSAMMRVADAAPMAQESFSEYHLYTLGRRSSINNNETKQLSMLSGSGVPMEKVYIVEGQNFYYHNYQHPGTPLKDNVQVFYKFKNDLKSGLGIPMPAGNVRVYQSDSKGGIQFVGEDRINHTPKDETLNIKIGNAFDVVCERKQTDYKQLSPRLYEMEFEITLRNHKESAITVEVNEPIGGDWEMVKSSHEYIKSAAFAARFNVPVEKDGTSVLRYRIRAKW
ncbi:MAG: DUF4139 domain-containing protein [Acidobacteria bacterium]|nr:DUF4139 domain-containing protein [Acidobacteriota bacterium]